jgi:hypothetical protein
VPRSSILPFSKTPPIKTGIRKKQEIEDDSSDVQPMALQFDNSSESESETPANQRNADESLLCHSTSDIAEICLVKLLHDANAPHYLYKDILEWGRKCKSMNFDFNPVRSNRKAVLSHIANRYELDYLKPFQIDVNLPTQEPGTYDKIKVTTFDFPSMLRSLFADKELFGDLNNLDVPQHDPFSQYKGETKYITSANSGSWYTKAWKKLCTNDNDFLVPIIFACDETRMGKCGACPLVFTTSLLKQKFRNLSTAWRPLGYIFDLGLLKSNKQNKNMSGDLKSLRLHTIYKAVLRTYHDAQVGNSLQNISVTLGDNFKKTVNLKVPLFFIIGDIQGGDKMCCTTTSYNDSLSRPCRKCNVKGSDLSNTKVECKKIVMSKIVELIHEKKLDKLKDLNQKNVHSIFFDLCYGGCKYGIFSAACPIEALHSLENGMMPYMETIVFDEHFKPKACGDLDLLVQKLTKLPKQRLASSGAVIEFPRLLWKNGITNLKDLEAKYKVGIMFTMVVISFTDEGKALFSKVFKNNLDKTSDVIQCFEMVLCYWMWLKKDKYWKRGNQKGKERAKTAIRAMLSQIKKLLHRDVGQGWNICKFHEQLHVPDDIDRNGPPRGSHTGPTEHHHIDNVKNYYQTTSKIKFLLDFQLATRNSEGWMINLAHNAVNYKEILEEKSNNSLPFTGVPTWSGKWHVELNRNCHDESANRVPQEVWVAASKIADEQPDDLQKWIETLCRLEYYSGFRDIDVLKVSTDYVRDGVIFRGHPNYRSEGPWNDWVMLQFERSEHDNRQDKKKAKDNHVAHGTGHNNYEKYYYVPGKVFGFYEMEGQTMAVMKFLDEASVTKTSVITTEWRFPENRGIKDIGYQAVSTDAFVRHCLVVPKNDEQSCFIEVWPSDLWADEFHLDE